MVNYIVRIFLLVAIVVLHSCNVNKTVVVLSQDKLLNTKEKSLLIDAKKDLLYGTTEDAISKFTEILKSDSLNSTVNFELAKIYYTLKQFDKSLYHSKIAYSNNPENSWFAKIYVQSLEESGNEKETTLLFSFMIDKWSNDIDLWYDFFRFLDSKGNYKLLNVYLNRFEKIFGFSDELIINRYQSFVKQKKYKDAEKYLLSVLKVNSKSEIANLILADFYSASYKFDKALEIYNRLLEIDKNNDQALIGKIKVYLQKGDINSTLKYTDVVILNPRIELNIKLSLIMELSQTLEKLKDFNTKRFDDLIVSLYNQYPDNADVRYFHGNVQFRNKNNKLAIDDFLFSLKIKPNNLQLWLFTLYIIEQEKNYTRLISIADSALIYFPNQKEIFLLRGFGYMETKQFEKSYEDFLFARKLTGELDEDKAQIIHYLAEVCYKRGDLEQAFKYYDEILTIDSNDVVALNNYAYYLALEKKDLNKALEMSGKTIKKEPDNSTYLDTYAYILFLIKKYPEALKYIELAILKGGTNSGAVLEHYGDILYMNGQVDLAVSTWKEAKEKGETSEFIDIKIETKKLHE